MGKILRVNQDNNQKGNTLNGWDKSTKYNSDDAEKIVDPLISAGGNNSVGNITQSIKEITSIPSPFARMELVKSAFEYVSHKDSNGNYDRIDGNTVWHKIVSDTLDVGQIFFELEDFRKRGVSVLTWDPNPLINNNELQKLLNTKLPQHKQLYETYRLYIDADLNGNNFNNGDPIFILTYKGEAIGATSPKTLFFSSARDYSKYSDELTFGNDKPFDDQYCPLYSRSLEYHKWWVHLKNVIANFGITYKCIYDYLEACDSYLRNNDMNRWNELQSVDNTPESLNFDTINLTINANSTIKAGGIDLLGLSKNPSKVVSDFFIKSNKPISGLTPMVLPADSFASKWKYVSDIVLWDPNTKVGQTGLDVNINNRVLPGINQQYPYLTMSDFLEDRIIKLDGQKFNTAHYNDFGYCDIYCNEKKKSTILIPVKPLFFKYFSVDDLKKMLHFEKNAGLIVLSLEIPVSGGKIKFQKTYCSNDIDEADYSFAIFPLVKFEKKTQSMYRVALASEYDDFDSYSMELYSDEKTVEVNNSFERNQTSNGDIKCRVSSVEGKLFDYVRLSYKGNSGLVIPDFRPTNSNSAFYFSIDFGTTNTHIEYKVEGGAAEPIPFDITKDDMQLCMLAEPSYAHKLMYEMDIVPELLGDKYRFPMRTALCCSEKTNWNGTATDMPIISYLQASVAFSYEKLTKKKYNAPTITGLKWLNLKDNNGSKVNEKKIKCYIESLLFLIRNKVLLNSGDLTKTKICWFYPISMTRGRLNSFKQLWNDAYKKFFGGEDNCIYSIAESVAPYEHFRQAYSKKPKIMTIDIGGGTTDVAYADNTEIKFISSFRFAANSIFGTSNNGYGSLNGIVEKHIEFYKKGLKNNNDLSATLKTIENNKDSENLASFFFSVHNNISDNKDEYDFVKLLEDDAQSKIVLLTFYTAIIYHVASIIKAKGLEMPDLIAFSGNGARVLKSITSDKDTLKKYTQDVVKLLGFGEKSFSLEISDNPKEATCKGGIMKGEGMSYDDVSMLKVVLKGCDNETFVGDNDKYKDIDDAYVEMVSKQAEKFFVFLTQCLDKFKVKDTFSIDTNAINIAKELFKDSNLLKNNTSSELSKKRNEVEEADEIEETMFFYPIIGVLEDLASKINK